jgi:O-antigen ligase
MIQNKIKISSIKNLLLQCIAFTLPLNKSLVPLLIILAILIWFVEGNFTEKLKALKTKFFLLSVLLYLIYIVGLLYTNNLKAGGFELEQKLSLLIFPLLFISDTYTDNIRFNEILKSFVVGCILGVVICVANAVFKYYLFGNINSFLYAQFSQIMHTSYFSMYLCFAVLLLLFNQILMQNHTLKLIIVIFLMIAVVLIASKSGLFSLALILMAKLMYDIVVKKSYIRVLIFSSLLIVTTVLSYNIFPKAFVRVLEMKKALTSSNTEINTNTSRIEIWKIATKIISNNYLLGVGTGDVKEAFQNEYDKQPITLLSEKKLNAHNQYLQTFIAIGLPGILMLLSLLTFTTYLLWINKILDGVIGTLIIAFNLLFESMFETQAGVVFIAFFLMLYFSQAIKQSSAKSVNIAT